MTLVVSAGDDNPPAAFAVEPQEGGGVTIEVYGLRDASGLEQILAEAGARSQVTWLRAGMACREPHYTPSAVKSPGGGTIGGFDAGGPGESMTITVIGTEQWRERRREYMRGELSAEEYLGSSTNVSLGAETFRSDQTLVLSGSPAPYDGDPEGGYEAHFGIAEGPVGPCEPVPAESEA